MFYHIDSNPGQPASSLEQLRGSSTVQRINRFMASPGFVLLIGLLALLSNVFSLELPVYTFFVLCGVYLSIFGADFLPLMPIVICCYIAPSMTNNPGRNPQSIFYPEHGGLLLYAMAGFFALTVLWRLRTDRNFGGAAFLNAERKLLPGILILGCAYLLSGAGSGLYFSQGWGNLVFAVLQFLSVFAAYYFFTGAVVWKNAPRNYFAWVGFTVGIVLILELVNIYRISNVILGGSIFRDHIATGWGMRNNIGGLLAVTIPFVFYLSCQKKMGWLFHLFALAFIIATCFTCSRGGMVGAAGAYAASYFVMFKKGYCHRFNLILLLAELSAISLFVAVFFDDLYRLFFQLIDWGLNPTFRDEFFVEGFKQFLKYPLFGGSFYPTDYDLWDWSSVDAFSSFFPPRWHNTLVQLAASCGVAGLAAYGFHRYQTVRLFLRQPSIEMAFIAVCIGVLLGISLFDSHMFNVGPVLLYSMLLAFGEKCKLCKD